MRCLMKLIKHRLGAAPTLTWITLQQTPCIRA
jgi:hypothetical protein